MRALLLTAVLFICVLFSACKTEYVMFAVSDAVDKVYKEHMGDCKVLDTFKSPAIQVDYTHKCFERGTDNRHISIIINIKHATTARYELNKFLSKHFKPINDLVLFELMRHVETASGGNALEIVLYRIEKNNK